MTRIASSLTVYSVGMHSVTSSWILGVAKMVVHYSILQSVRLSGLGGRELQVLGLFWRGRLLLRVSLS